MNVRIKITGTLLAALLLGFGAAGAQAGPERFDGRIIDMAQKVRGSADFFTLQVDRWGNEEEAAAFLTVLKQEGQKGLVDAFWKTKECGFIKVGASLGYPVIFARQFATPEGRTVRAFTDRPIQFFELRNNLRSADYPLGIIEIKFPKNGKGEGTLVAAASAKYNDQGQLEIERLGTIPFKLTNMKAYPVKVKDKK